MTVSTPTRHQRRFQVIPSAPQKPDKLRDSSKFDLQKRLTTVSRKGNKTGSNKTLAWEANIKK